MPAHFKPITINGITYPSRTAAAQALGIDPRTLYTRIHRGNLNPRRVFIGRAIPVTINGESFGSLGEAARALGVSTTIISNLCAKHGPVFDYRPKADRYARRPVTIDKQTFPSVAEASRILGISYHKLYRMYPPEGKDMARVAGKQTIPTAHFPH